MPARLFAILNCSSFLAFLTAKSLSSLYNLSILVISNNSLSSLASSSLINLSVDSIIPFNIIASSLSDFIDFANWTQSLKILLSSCSLFISGNIMNFILSAWVKLSSKTFSFNSFKTFSAVSLFINMLSEQISISPKLNVFLASFTLEL